MKKHHYLLPGVLLFIFGNTQCVLNQPLPLYNYANSCYINSILQSLISLTPFTTYVSSLEENPYNRYLIEFEEITEKNNPAYFYIPFIKTLANASPSIISSKSYYTQLKPLSESSGRFTEQRCDDIGSQQDASEFLGKLIDEFRNSDNIDVENKINKLFSFARFESTFCNLDEFWSDKTSSQETYLNIPTSKERELKPENPKNKQDFLEDLSSLKACLDNRFLPFTFYRDEQKCQRITMLNSSPQILIIVLQRYYFIPIPDTTTILSGKNNHIITIPFELYMGEFVRGAQKNDLSHAYDLIACAAHGGTTTGGHFVAYVNYPTGWWYCSDTILQPKSSSNVQEAINKNAYILFYQKKNPTIILQQQLTNLTNALHSLQEQLTAH